MLDVNVALPDRLVWGIEVVLDTRDVLADRFISDALIAERVAVDRDSRSSRRVSSATKAANARFGMDASGAQHVMHMRASRVARPSLAAQYIRARMKRFQDVGY